MTTRQYRFIAVLAATALSGMLLAGCGQAGDGDTAAPGGTVSETPTPSPNPSNSTGQPRLSPSQVVPSGNVGGDKSAGGEITVTGQVEEGVEAGCTLLRTADKTYLLLGGDQAMIRQGGRLTVRGKPQPGMMTTCQQGTPFQVSETRRG